MYRQNRSLLPVNLKCLLTYVIPVLTWFVFGLRFRHRLWKYRSSLSSRFSRDCLFSSELRKLDEVSKTANPDISDNATLGVVGAREPRTSFLSLILGSLLWTHSNLNEIPQFYTMTLFFLFLKTGQQTQAMNMEFV